MRPYARKLMAVLMAGLCLFIAAAAAFILFTAASDYVLSIFITKFYCLLWFIAAVLSIYAGLLTASPCALVCTGLGFTAFAAICMLDANFTALYPGPTRYIEIAAPALFITAWPFIVIAAFRSPKPAIRTSAWIWLMVAFTVLFAFPAYNYGKFQLCKLRDEHLLLAAAHTLTIADRLSAYQRVHGVYPDTLEPAGVDITLTQLPYRGQTIKYFGSRSMFILTFEDPLLSGPVVYSWDTSKNGWFPSDPHESLNPAPHNLFLGSLSGR